MEKTEIDKLLLLANYYFENNLHGNAVPILHKILLSEPDNSNANELLAYIIGNNGKLEEAHSLLLKACQDPNCTPSSLYYLGKSFLNQLNFENAILYFQLSLQKRGDFFEALLDLGITFTKVSKFTEAISYFNRALCINNNSYILYYNIAKTFLELDNTYEALLNYDKALLINPNFPQAWYNKGILLNRLKRFPEAIDCFDNAIVNKPDYADAWLNKGIVLTSVRRFDEAINCYLNTLKINPTIIKAWSEYGVTLFELNLYDEAIFNFDKALALDENFIDALINKGNTLVELKFYNEAMLCFDKALSINPNSFETWTNKGVLFHCLRNYNEALLCHYKAIEINPNFEDAWSNYGVVLIDLKKYNESLKYFHKAILINPDYSHAHNNLSYALFNLGQFQLAWIENEWRFKINNLNSHFNESKVSQWKGNKALNTLFIWAEQGIGDQILYSSVFRDLYEFPQNIIISINAKLIPLFSRSFPKFKFISNNNIKVSKYTDYQEQIPIGSVAKFFRNSFNDFNNSHFPYLVHDKEKSSHFADKLKSNKKLTCGISWKSYNNDLAYDKSIPFVAFSSLLRLDTISFILLQDRDSDFLSNDLVSSHSHLIKQLDGVDLFNDIDTLASVIMTCDFVVTCSNSIAHLSGALNKLTYLILPYACGRFWYWNEHDGKCLWYPSIKIFHQDEDLSWEKPIDRIANSLT